MYLQLAANISDHFVFSRETVAPFTPEVFRTPGYPAFLAIFHKLGIKSLYWVAFFQELVYLGCVGMFFRYGRVLFSEKMVRAGVLFLLVEPGGLAYPKEIFTEVLFLPWLLGGILAVGYYLRFLNWRYLLLAGVLMGLGAMIRPGLLYLPLVITGTLLLFDLRNKQRWIHAGVFLFACIMVVSPWLVRNHHHFDKVFMSGQQSNMLANYHVPIVLEAAKGISFESGREYMLEQVAQATKTEQSRLHRPLSTVEIFQLEQQVAFKELANYPKDYLLQWGYGIIKVMVSANMLELDHVLHIPIEGLKFPEGKGFTDRVFRFLQKQDHLYVFAVIFRFAVAGFALLVVVSIIKSKDCFLWIIMLTNFYFICSAGPMGYARYRFPVEVFWFIQAYTGLIWVMALFRQWQAGMTFQKG